MKPPRITFSNIVIFIYCIAACALLTQCLTPAQKDKAKVMAEQILTNVGKEAGIAVASVATDLAQLKLTQAQAKLAATRAAVTADTSAKDLAKLGVQEVAAKQAAKLLAQADAELAKLKTVDALPAPLTPLPDTITGVVVTP